MRRDLRAALLASTSAFSIIPVAAHSLENRAGQTRLVFRVEVPAADQAAAKALEPDLTGGIRIVERFFAKPFPRPFVVSVFSDRATFDARLKRDFEVPEPQRWMVAAGISSQLAILLPVKWRSDAVEHDGSDKRQVREIVAHELVHVYHAQMSPSKDFEGMDDMAWLVEGVAVYASGQLERTHRGDDERAVREGKAPGKLADAWSGKYRYGVSGSLARFVDKQFGRKTLVQLLRSTRNAEALSILKLSEAAFLDEWKRSLLSSAREEVSPGDHFDSWKLLR